MTIAKKKIIISSIVLHIGAFGGEVVHQRCCAPVSTRTYRTFAYAGGFFANSTFKIKCPNPYPSTLSHAFAASERS